MQKIITVFLLLLTVAFSSAISNIQVGDVTSELFAISWKSASPEAGTVTVLSSSGDQTMNGVPIKDIRDASVSAVTDTVSNLHFVLMHAMYSNIVGFTGAFAPNTTYTVQINSGGTLATLNVTTGPILTSMMPISDTRSGYVLDANWSTTNAGNVLYTSFIEHRNADGSVLRSAPRIYIANMTDYVTWADYSGYYENLAIYRSADLQSFFYPLANNPNDDLVTNFTRGDGTDIQLRRALSVVTTVSVSLTPNIFPVIDNFDTQANLAVPAGWNAQLINAQIVPFGYSSAKSLQFSGWPSASNPYFAGYISKYLNDGKALDWLQYRYIKIVFQNQGAVGAKLLFNLFDDPNMTYTPQGPFVATLNLVNYGVWTEAYIPLNDFILKGSRAINFRQGIKLVGADNALFAGPNQIGFALISATPTGHASVLIDGIELVTSLPTGTDSDWDGIADSVENAYGITSANILADNNADGVLNYSELVNGLNPNPVDLTIDSDGDGLPDSWEDASFGVASNAKNIATGIYGASGDPDVDGYTNIVEYQAGTDPTVAASHPGGTSIISQVQVVNLSGMSFDITWLSASPEYGYVVYGVPPNAINTLAQDVRVTQNPKQSYTRHYVTVESVPNTTYNFDIISGTVTHNNGGLHYSIKTPSSNIAGNPDRRYGQTYGSPIWNYDVGVYYEMWLEDHDGAGSLGRSQLCAGLSNVAISQAGSIVLKAGWDATLQTFRTSDNNNFFSYSAADYLVINFFNDDYNRKTQLRLPLTVISQDVSLIQSLFPIIDNFETASVNFWQADANSGLSVSITNNAVGNYSLLITGSAALEPSQNYYAGFASKYIKIDDLNNGKHLDWGQYRYLKMVLKNTGPIGSKVDIKLYQNTAPTHSASLAEIYNVTMNLQNTNVFNTIYIPINNVIVRKESGLGNGVFEPYQIVAGNQIYPGVLMLGMSLVAPTKLGAVSVIVDDVALVNSIGAVDADWDGIADSVESAYGITSANILADNNFDGVLNYSALVNGLNPNVVNTDSDSDGLPDYWEDLYFGVASNAKNIATGIYGASGDPDADGYTNIVEYQAGTDPTVAASHPGSGASSISRVSITNVSDASFSVSWWSSSSEPATLNYGTTTALGSYAFDSRETKSWIIHKIDVYPVTPNTQYYFSIQSGQTTDDNGGACYTVKTAPVDINFNFTSHSGQTYQGEGMGAWTPKANVYYEVWLEDHDGLGSLGKSQLRSGLSNIRFWDTPTFTFLTTSTGWQAMEANFRNANLIGYFSASSNDFLVANFFGEDGSKTQLRVPLSAVTQDVSLVSTLFPTIDNFESSTVNGWESKGAVSLAASITSNALGNGALLLQSPAATNYFGGFASKYITGGDHLDWGQYQYLRVTFKNAGDPGAKVNVKLYQNQSLAPTYSADLAEVYNVSMNLLQSNIFTTMYIPLNNTVIRKDSGAGSGIFNPNQVKSGATLYAGILQLGLSVVGATATGPVALIVDDVALVTTASTGFTDNDLDGIDDALEALYGINSSNILADFDSDGLSNYVELTQGSNPLQSHIFPLIDSFEGNGPVWSAFDKLVIAVTHDAVGILDPLGQRVTSMSMSMKGFACVDNMPPLFGLPPPSQRSGSFYYAGLMQANIGDATTDWSQYKSIKFIAKNNVAAGDRLIISIRDNDNNNGSIDNGAGSAGDDTWEFTQVIKNNGTWNYYTVLLPTAVSMNGWVDTNPSTGNGIVDLAPVNGYPGVLQISIINVKGWYYGATDMQIDHIELSNETNSIDNDGDGLPNDWEDFYFGVSSDAKNIATGDYGADGDPDGDSDSNIKEYWLGTIPTQKAGFPELETFEPYAWPGGLDIYIGQYSRNAWQSDDPLSAVNVLLSTDTSGSGGVNSMLMSGTASNYYAGFVGGYTAQGLPYSWTGYKYLKFLVKNSGTVGDKLKIQLKDNDTNVYSADADDAFEYEISTLKAGQWQEITIPFSLFTDINPGVGNDVWDPATGTNPDGGVMGGVKYMGFALLAGSASGKVTFNIDNLMLVNTPNTADTNGDGLPDWWSVLLGISVTDSSQANGPMGDLDNDGMPNMLEYMNLTSPLVVNSTLPHGADNIPTSWKINYGLSLNADVSLDDPDGDGIDNYHEYLIGSSPLMNNNLYASHNSIPDFWQIAYTGTTNILNNPAGKDTDGDGVTDYNAYLQGINPNVTKILVGPGWNLLSLGYNGSIDALIAAINTQNYIIGAAKWYLNLTTYQYEWLDYRTGAGAAFTVIQNEAIYFESTGVFSFISPSAPSSVTTYNFVVGWNPMSRVLGSSLTIQQLKDSIDPRPLGTEPHKLVAVAVYRGGAWNIYNFVTQTATGPIKLSLSEALSRHAGYMLNFASNVDWTPAN